MHVFSNHLVLIRGWSVGSPCPPQVVLLTLAFLANFLHQSLQSPLAFSKSHCSILHQGPKIPNLNSEGENSTTLRKTSLSLDPTYQPNAAKKSLSKTYAVPCNTMVREFK